MPRQRHTKSEIAVKLAVAEDMLSQGKTHNEIVKVLDISMMTYHRWRKARPDPIETFRKACEAAEEVKASGGTKEAIEAASLKYEISDTTIKRAISVIENGIKELRTSIENGSLSLEHADKISKFTKDTQPQQLQKFTILGKSDTRKLLRIDKTRVKNKPKKVGICDKEKQGDVYCDVIHLIEKLETELAKSINRRSPITENMILKELKDRVNSAFNKQQ